MKPLLLAATSLLIFANPLFLSGCTCGFDCSSDDDDPSRSVPFDLALSGALLEGVKEVVIEVEAITLTRSAEDGGNVVIDEFTLDANAPVDSFTMNLLDYAGEASLPVIDGFSVSAGDYNSVQLSLSSISGDSYVLREDDQQFDLLVTNNRLSLAGVRLTEDDESYTVKFELARALTFESANENYRLSDDGVRVVDNTRDARIIGVVEEALLDAAQSCADKDNPDTFNRVYLYQGRDLDAASLADVFRSNSGPEIPDGALAPYAIDLVTGDSRTGVWAYALAYLPPGDYTLAFTCNSEDDDALDYDGLVIPLPQEQRYELTLSSNEVATCNLAVSAQCIDD